MFKAGIVKGGIWTLLLLLGLLPVGGCNKPVGQVSGHTSYQGKALDHGTVTLVANDGSYWPGEINSDGSYLVANVPPGKARVIVTSIDPRFAEDAKKIIEQARRNTTGEAKPLNLDPGRYHNLPDQYGDLQKSGLEVEVHPGPNTFDITLK
jgi:hypothetical protein